MSDIAIAHGALDSDGGAERVAIALARAFDAPIYATSVNSEFVPSDVEAHELFNTTWANRFLQPGIKPDLAYWLGKHLYTMQRAQWVSELYEYDTVIVAKPELSWFIPKDDQTLVQYVHHVQRRHYDQFYHQGESFKERCWSLFHRTLHKTTVDYPDLCICNSELTERRAHRYWGVPKDKLTTVYPPVDTEETNANVSETQDYLFYVGRLASNKRIGLLRDVAESIDREVVVAGTGPEKDTLLHNKPDNLTYLGYLSESEKFKRLSEARATLFLAENEDFGIVPIESMAAGTPVIGVAEGYTKHQIRDGENGILCGPTIQSVTSAVDRFYAEGVNWSDDHIAQFASQFNHDRFETEIRGAVTRAQERATVDTELEIPVKASEVDHG